MSATPADRLRHRATTLRILANRLHHLQVLGISEQAGPTTWVGPSPQACADDLRMRRRQLVAAADELTREARRFERLAADLDAAATIPGVR